MQWNHDPTMWERIASISLGVWLLVGFATLAGFAAARRILVPRDASRDLNRADKLALLRTWIGFAFVLFASLPYRSFGGTADKVLGNFNISVPIALAVCAVSMAVFWFVIKAESKECFRSELPSAVARCGEFILTLGLSWGIVALLDSPADTHDEALLGLIALGGFLGLYGSGCWCISRYWFGIGRVHPLLPPVVATGTICIMTSAELHSGGPEGLPTALWLMINFAAVITTFSVCFVEACDAYMEGRTGWPSAPHPAPAKWPVTAAVVILIIAMAAAVLFICSGAAERTLCAGATHIVRCTASSV